MNTSTPILIVEDDPVTQKLLEKILRDAGYKAVLCAENGREALKILEEQFFPVVITDWLMPVMDGLEFCRTLRKADLPGYVYIIMLTIKDTREDIIKGLEAGADEYLIKPINASELLVRLQTARRILELEKTLKRTNEAIRALTIRDSLTGIFNRVYLMERLPQELKRSHRYGHALSVIMCDIDHFKDINDAFGHKAGDEILKEFVQCLEGSIRKDIDWIARYGGEEFLVVLPETDLEPAFLVAERLRRLVAEKTFRVKGREIRITSSFGIASFDPGRDTKVTFDLLMEQADEFMYQAKREGRNRVKGQPIPKQPPEAKGASYEEENIGGR